MNRFSAWSRELVHQHVYRLVETLERWIEKLRASLAHSIGDMVGHAVHELSYLLAGSPQLSSSPARWRQRESSGWDDNYHSEWDEEPRDNYRDADPDEAGPRENNTGACWRKALSAGLQAASWWLKRQAGRFPVLTSAALGLAAALGYAAAPGLGVGMVAVVGVLLHLIGLTDAVAEMSR